MNRWMCRTLAAFLTCFLLPAWAAAGLREDIERAVRTGDLGSATVGVSVREAGPGTPLAELDADRLFIPASNMKLLTTGAALHTLGEDFRFHTQLLLDDDKLIAVGDGDPAFGDPELLAEMESADGVGLDAEAFLDLWVQPLVGAGVEQVSALLVDDRIFDREFVHSTWPRDQLKRRYCAQVAGLSFHLNVLHFFPKPRPGQRPSVQDVLPRTDWMQIRNQATSRDGVHDHNDVWIARRLGTNELTFYGNVRHPYRTNPVPVTIHDVPDFFATLLADRVREAGIEVQTVGLVDPDAPESEGRIIAPVIYTPISTIVTRCNRDSENLYAECLLKRMGHALTGQPGSWLNGAAIVRHVVHERLDDPALSSRLAVADGSGMSRDNRVAPALLTAWLNSFHNDERLGAIFLDSLAVGGESGTLRRRTTLHTSRLHGAIVRAKSGYINGVSCLSGYVTVSDGRRRCFCVMINDLNRPVRRAKKLQADIVRMIARDMIETEAPVQLGGG
ncbi:MAG: D-alanyl-D-alanine carboxypeptidase/D-alanyl-D-alanine-endopeptidase [Planctomycetota bacterium]|nr:D-alanyl-D-alanine carboxypeptidase/D-alanyl-D-alanine-endopeptidase [Planctomycetota bacterium]